MLIYLSYGEITGTIFFRKAYRKARHKRAAKRFVNRLIRYKPDYDGWIIA